MTDPKKPAEAPVIDLDEYRKKREQEGTWPPDEKTVKEYWREIKRKHQNLLSSMDPIERWIWDLHRLDQRKAWALRDLHSKTYFTSREF